MTQEQLDAAIEEVGEQAFELIKVIVDPEEDTSRAQGILREMLDVSKEYVDIAGAVPLQSKPAVIMRVLEGAMGKAADIYFPLVPTGDDAPPPPAEPL